MADIEGENHPEAPMPRALRILVEIRLSSDPRKPVDLLLVSYDDETGIVYAGPVAGAGKFVDGKLEGKFPAPLRSAIEKALRHTAGIELMTEIPYDGPERN